MPGGHIEGKLMVNGEVIKFKYPDIVADNYRYRGEVCNKNSLRHDGGKRSQIGLESEWGKIWWSI